nr:reverse transcriptase domain-containing protein [Tanacetum cinerariifolium]
MLRTCYGHCLTKGTIIKIFYHGLDDLIQGILDARGIFLYKTPNEAFKFLKDKVFLKLDFSSDSQNNPKPKTIVFASGNNINSDRAILMEKLEALVIKINSEFLKIKKELKQMRDGHRDNHASQIYMRDDTSMYDPMEANYTDPGALLGLLAEWLKPKTEPTARLELLPRRPQNSSSRPAGLPCRPAGSF